MKKVQVGNVIIGEGITKMCVPVVGENLEEIKQQAENIRNKPADLVEFRIDYLKTVNDAKYIYNIADSIKSISEKPVIMTFRTAFEGGNKEITREEYADLLMNILQQGPIDIIDVEMFMGDNLVEEIVEEAHNNNTKVIMSNHDFHKTPEIIEIVGRLRKMESMGADIAKIAVMPANSGDVIKLLQAANTVYSDINIPIVTMSMSGIGLISRISGEIFGSSITFGTVGKISAPGQIEVDKLKPVLEIIHKNII